MSTTSRNLATFAKTPGLDRARVYRVHWLQLQATAQPASVGCSRRGAEVEQAHASPITSLHRTVSPDRISHNCVTVGGSPLAYVRLYPPLSKLFGCMGVAWD